MRPHQWVKNGFVLTGLLFGHAWTEPALVQAALLAVIAFCLASSSVYVFNDLFDREQDQLHPVKCRRPLASGAVTPNQGWMLTIGLALAALIIARMASPLVVTYVLAYLLLNVVYTLRLKHIVILDIFCISAGFMLRILAGTDGIEIPPSNWLVVCGLWTTLFLGFIKRRAEIFTLAEEGGEHRAVLNDYSPALLDKLIGITCTGMILSYSLYTMDENIMLFHGTERLYYTVPFVMYACFRYLFLLHNSSGGGDPSRDLFRDPHIALAGLGWLMTVLSLVAL
jgi:4-hydroxybenzoate polyprenyltransferase